MPSKTHHLLTILSAALCMAASAQNCALPPGTVGIGKYCTRDSVAIPIAQLHNLFLWHTTSLVITTMPFFTIAIKCVTALGGVDSAFMLGNEKQCWL